MPTMLDEAQVQGLKVDFQILFQIIKTKLASSLSNILWHDTTLMDLLLSHWFKEHLSVPWFVGTQNSTISAPLLHNKSIEFLHFEQLDWYKENILCMCEA